MEFVSISWVINHMTCYNFECSHLWKIYLNKNPLQDLLSSLNAVISTNEITQCITGHVIYNPARGLYLHIPTENHQREVVVDCRFWIFQRVNHQTLLDRVCSIKKTKWTEHCKEMAINQNKLVYLTQDIEYQSSANVFLGHHSKINCIALN